MFFSALFFADWIHIIYMHLNNYLSSFFKKEQLIWYQWNYQILRFSWVQLLYFYGKPKDLQ